MSVEKKIITDRIGKLSRLLTQKEEDLKEDPSFYTTSITQGNINNIRSLLADKKFFIDRADDHPMEQRKIYLSFRKELDSLENLINDLKIVNI